MRDLLKRLKQLEHRHEMMLLRTAPRQTIEEAALGRLSAADRELYAHRNEGSQETPEYKSMMVRFEAAYAATSQDRGIPYIDALDRGWL